MEYSFSTPPGTRYEYSNYAFGLLGRVVTKAAGVPYEQYVHTEILSKLHMNGSTFRFADVPAARRAIGYRLKPDGTYAEEPPLPHGVFGSMGGLLTTATEHDLDACKAAISPAPPAPTMTTSN